jgi:pyrimidine-nucleoside phosphorylase/thymidine phosphorylase
VDDPSRLPRAARLLDVPSPATGSVEAIDAEAVGLAAMALGAGRAKVEDRVDAAAGIRVRKRLGDRVERGEPLCTLHCGAAGEPPERVAGRVAAAWRIGPAEVAPPPLLIERMAP